MKKILGYITALLLIGSVACDRYDTAIPDLQKFGIYEIVDEMAGPEIGLSSVPANTTIRMQVLTDCAAGKDT